MQSILHLNMFVFFLLSLSSRSVMKTIVCNVIVFIDVAYYFEEITICMRRSSFILSYIDIYLRQ